LPIGGPLLRGTEQEPELRGSVVDHLTRLCDLVLALLLLTITGPLLVFAAVAIKFESPGPALEPCACGLPGARRLTLLKLRTRAPHTAASGVREAAPVGRFLEYTRIDELPQLINVLRGELGLIDPRRPRLHEQHPSARWSQ
jgi:putative colanic acid biosynthesis UDP-glucose lipid carrier transferase